MGLIVGAWRCYLGGMDKSTNYLDVRSLMRTDFAIPANATINGSGTRRMSDRDVERRMSGTAPAAIERLVLVSPSRESSSALEKRAQLLAKDMHLSHSVARFDREDDVFAKTKASDLILTGRKQPVPFIVPYLGRAARGLLRKSRAPMLVV